MNMDADQHLDYDDLLVAVVDVDDLPQGKRDHLEKCAQCRRQLQRTTERLESIGRIASRLAPDPARSVRIHGRQRLRRPLPGRKKSLMAMALVAMLVVFVSVASRHFFKTAGGPLSGADQVGKLIADVNRLVENPLPPGYASLAAVADPLPMDDPTTFVVPGVGEPVQDDYPENERIAG